MTKETRYLLIVADRSGWSVTRKDSIRSKLEELDFMEVESILEIGKVVKKNG